MPRPLRFALNRMVAPSLSLVEFIDLALELQIDAIELRNDLPGVEITDGTPPERVRELCASRGVRVLSINALYPFDVWNPERERQLRQLAEYAVACGARGLVLCPLNEAGDPRDAAQRELALRSALEGIAPVLRRHGLYGFIEPLGFEESALRSKRLALEAVRDTASLNVLRLLHDTFHHRLAGDQELFAELTALVHISGVEEAQAPLELLRDDHRVLVGAADRLGNVAQLKALLHQGYTGYLSFEPFAACVHGLVDVRQALGASIDHLRQALE